MRPKACSSRGAGNDTFNLNTWQSGAALIVVDGAGNDNFFVSPTAHSLPAAISNMSFFSYNGGASGFSHFRVWNDFNASAWTVTRTSTDLTYVSGAYFCVFNLAHIDQAELVAAIQLLFHLRRGQILIARPLRHIFSYIFLQGAESKELPIALVGG